jgi:hypothetical protein
MFERMVRLRQPLAGVRLRPVTRNIPRAWRVGTNLPEIATRPSRSLA